MDFYFHEISAPCRAVMLTAKACGLALNKKKIDLMAEEHLKPEFVALNPQHVIPTLKDGDFVLWESRAILGYLANKSGNDSLYPKDPKTRAQVDKMLYFDMGTLYDRFANYCYTVVFEGLPENPKNLEKLHEALGFFDKFLEGHDFVVGNSITIADHSLAASVSTFTAYDVDIEKHKNVAAWFKRCQTQMPGYAEENGAGAKAFGDICKSMKK